MHFELWSEDPKLSYKISKNPSTIFERDLRDNTHVKAWWEDNVFKCHVEHDIELLLTHCKQTNKTSYNAAEFWVADPYNLQAFDEVFRSALRGKYDSNLTEKEVNEAYEYDILIGPVSEYDADKIEKQTHGMGLTINKLNNPVPYTACYLTISGYMSITEFLQKVYIFLYAYQYRYNLSFETNDKLEKFQRFFINWIDKVTNKEYVLNILTGHRLYKIKLLDEQLGLEKETYVKERQEVNLHALRHKAINLLLNETGTRQILDVGCGSGQILRHIDITDKYYIGIDSDERVYKIKSKPNIIRFQTNILCPYMPNYDRMQPTTAILSEVVEHFNDSERQNLYDLINNFYQPDYVIITTPNAEYNINFGMQPGQMRHRDHKIEFTPGTLNEVTQGLSSYHCTRFVTLIEGQVEEQPSFVMLFTRVKEKKEKTQAIRFLNNLYKFDDSQNKSIAKGLCHRAVLQNSDDLFYLGPTISPAEGNGIELESLEKAIAYYKKHGVKEVVFQEKVMGSRAYVLWFSNEHVAQHYGYNSSLIINSRNGFTFFEDEKLMFELWQELKNIVGYMHEMVMLDCEITPWKLKAEGLIKNEFKIPLESEYLHRWYDETDEKRTNVFNTLQSLSQYSQDDDIKIHVFDVLALDGNNVMNKNVLQNINYFTMLFNQVKCKYFTMVETTFNAEYIKSITRFTEGIVVKPLERGNGILPALKVRNTEYLRLIYGAHYQQYLAMLQNRPTNRKRKQSYNQYTLAYNIVTAVCNNDIFARLQNVGLFLNDDTSTVQDKTL